MLKKEIIYLLVVCVALQKFLEQKIFSLPCESFSFVKHLDFSSPHSWKGLKLTISQAAKLDIQNLFLMCHHYWGCQHSSGKIVLACYWKVSQWRKDKIKVQIQQHAQYCPYSAKFLNGYWTLIKCLKTLVNKSLYTLWAKQS